MSYADCDYFRVFKYKKIYWSDMYIYVWNIDE